MKAVVQRVRNASVSVEGSIRGIIQAGLLVYLGVARGDAAGDADRLAKKIVHLRIFDDEAGRMNLSLKELPPESSAVLAVSQFTLLADVSRGRRPYYGGAADNNEAKKLYEYFIQKIKSHGVHCESGVFQAHMDVRYTNDGPVTILLDSC